MTMDQQTMTRTTLRVAGVDDAEEIAALISRVAVETFLAGVADERRRYFLAMNTGPAVAGRLRDEAYRYHVAEHDGIVVGVVGMRGNLHVYDLYVDTSLHGQGIGRQLWEHARRDCLRLGNRGHFTVNSRPNAVPAYQSFGFVPSGEECERHGMPVQPMTLDG